MIQLLRAVGCDDCRFAPLAMEERMRGLAQLIKALKPDVLMFQVGP